MHEPKRTRPNRAPHRDSNTARQVTRHADGVKGVHFVGGWPGRLGSPRQVGRNRLSQFRLRMPHRPTLPATALRGPGCADPGQDPFSSHSMDYTIRFACHGEVTEL